MFFFHRTRSQSRLNTGVKHEVCEFQSGGQPIVFTSSASLGTHNLKQAAGMDCDEGAQVSKSVFNRKRARCIEPNGSGVSVKKNCNYDRIITKVNVC